MLVSELLHLWIHVAGGFLTGWWAVKVIQLLWENIIVGKHGKDD